MSLVPLDAVPTIVADPASVDPVTDLALYGMSPNGTCTTGDGIWTLTGGRG